MHEADQVIHEALVKAEHEGLWVDLHDTFHSDFGLVDGGHPVIIEACKLLRNKKVGTRADALEFAFDFFLQRATKGEWERVGELWYWKDRKIVRALCMRVKEA